MKVYTYSEARRRFAAILDEARSKGSVLIRRRDGQEFMALAPQVPVQTHVVPYPLDRANEALTDLRDGRVQGAVVLTMT